MDLPIFRKVRKHFLGNENYPASTLVGIQSLGRKEWLIEIEAIAVVQ
jgi:enamine deaminase RidA (YjgF/YER057c/UK114 family)